MAKAKIASRDWMKFSTDFASEPLKGLWSKLDKSRKAHAENVKKSLEATGLEKATSEFEAAFVKLAEQKGPDSKLYLGNGAKTLEFAYRFGFAVAVVDKSSEGGRKGGLDIEKL